MKYAACFALFAACAVVNAEPAGSYNRREWMSKYVRPASIPYPDDNRYTQEREDLGRTLFFDPRLSNTGSMSCASCHNPGFSYGDGLPRAIGEGQKVLGRRTPTILNLAWAELLFWDGRAASLEEQALGPIAAAGEMNLSLDRMVKTVAGIPGYRPLFEKAYPGEPMNEKTVARAIATFERTVISGTAPFDRWIAGDESSISEAAKRGFDLFNTKAACAKCHTGWNFTDHGFHDIGVPGDNRGRGVHLPKLEAMQYAFKTPTLRNARERAPFLHDGSEATLNDVIDFYDKGGRVKRPSLSPDVAELRLTMQDKQDLMEFLRTLSSTDKPMAVPVMPR